MAPKTQGAKIVESALPTPLDDRRHVIHVPVGCARTDSAHLKTKQSKHAKPFAAVARPPRLQTSEAHGPPPGPPAHSPVPIDDALEASCIEATLRTNACVTLEDASAGKTRIAADLVLGHAVIRTERAARRFDRPFAPTARGDR